MEATNYPAYYYRWRAAKSIIFILKSYLYPNMRNSDFSRLLIYSKYLLIMEHRFDAILYSNLGNENSDAGHIKCSRGVHLARGPQVPHPWCTNYNVLKYTLVID